MTRKSCMRRKNLQNKPSEELVLPEKNDEVVLLQEEISLLKSELSLARQKLTVWNDIAEEGLFIHENFIIKEVNHGLVKLTGYSKEELVGKHGKVLITEESYENLKKHLSKDKSELFEVEMITKNGDSVIVNTKGKTIKVGNQIQRAVIVQNINEYKKAQKSIEESEERHRLISSLLSDYVYTCKIRPNEAPAIAWVSGAMEKISGYLPEEIEKLDDGWFSIIHPEDVQQVAESVNYNYSEHKFYSNQYRIIDKSGQIRWLQDKSICLNLDESTKELTLLGATKDISIRKKIEQDLQRRNIEFEQLNKNLKKANHALSGANRQLIESEKKYKNLIDNTLIGVGISIGEKILFANQSLLDIYGVKTFEQLASRKLTEYMPIDSKKMIKERLKKYRKNIPQENIFRHKILRSDGEIRTVQIVTNEIIFEGKKCRQALITDITTQQQTENALLQAANIFKNIQIGLLIYRLDDLDDDRSLRMIATNPTSSLLIGLSEEQMVGKKIDEIFPNLRKNKIPQQYAEVVRTQIPVAFDDIYYEDDRVIPAFFSVKVFPLPDQSVGISFENVSAKRKAERDLRTRNHELNNFVYKVSHDIRAPLSSIKGLINLSKLEKNYTNHLPKIEERVDHLDGFIRDILSHSRNLNTAVIIEKIKLEQVVKDWFNKLEDIDISKQISKEISITGVDFYNDKTRLSEIIRNLISNAIKYHDVSKNDRFIKVLGKVTKRSAKIIFDDNGIGIKTEFIKDIFKMFYRATEEAEGSGIGLYIVQQALEKVNGKVSVTSKFKIGTTFTIEIPNLASEKSTLI